MPIEDALDLNRRSRHPLEDIALGGGRSRHPLERLTEGRLPPPRRLPGPRVGEGEVPAAPGIPAPPPRAQTSSDPFAAEEAELLRRQSKIRGQMSGKPKDPALLGRQLEVIDSRLREIRFAREQAELRRQADQAGQFTDAQRRRLAEAQGIAGREIGEQSQLRLGQLESSLAGMGLGDSVVGERARAQERELSARMYQQTASQLLSGELQRTFAAEQMAIDRLFQSGQAELAFGRQWQLTQRQMNASLQIAEMQADSSLWGDIFGAAGNIVSAAIPFI